MGTNSKRSSNRQVTTDYEDDPLFKMLNEASHTVAFRPILRELTGDVNAALLLQQVIYRYIGKERKPLYKFHAPCDHPLYREGDSWTEEVGLTEDQITEALKKIATRTRRKNHTKVLQDTQPQFGPNPDKRMKNQVILVNRTSLVAYWKEADNALRFVLNEELLKNAVQQYPNVREEPDIPVSETRVSSSETGQSGSEAGETSLSYNIDDSTDDTKEDTTQNGKYSELTSSLASRSADDFDAAIAAAWQISAPGMIAEIKKTLLGLHRQGTKDFQSNVVLPATLEEIQDMALLIKRMSRKYMLTKMPTNPAKIQRWLYDARDLIPMEINHHGHKILLKVKLSSSMDRSPKKTILDYLRRFEPEEHERVQYLMKELDEKIGPAKKTRDSLYYEHKGEIIEIRVAVPNPIFEQSQSEPSIIWEYLDECCPEEATRLRGEFARIDRERQQDMEQTLSTASD